MRGWNVTFLSLNKKVTKEVSLRERYGLNAPPLKNPPAASPAGVQKCSDF